jgi:hypothetical protein
MQQSIEKVHRFVRHYCSSDFLLPDAAPTSKSKVQATFVATSDWHLTCLFLLERFWGGLWDE